MSVGETQAFQSVTDIAWERKESGYAVKRGRSYFKEPWVSPLITFLRVLDFEAPELFIFGIKEATLAVSNIPSRQVGCFGSSRRDHREVVSAVSH